MQVIIINSGIIRIIWRKRHKITETKVYARKVKYIMQFE